MKREKLKTVTLSTGEEVDVYNPLFKDFMSRIAKGEPDLYQIMKACIMSSTDLTQEQYDELDLTDGLRLMEVVTTATEAFNKYMGSISK